MEIWILRYSGPRQKSSQPRNLSVLQRNATGEVAELETVEIQGGNTNLPDMVERQVVKGRKRLVLDLHQEKRLDSNDLAQIIGACKYAADAGGELVLANPNVRVAEIFRITHLDDVMAIFDSIGDAANHLVTSD